MARLLVNTGEPIAVYIGRCSDRGCRRVYRWDVPEEVRITNPHLIPSTLCPRLFQPLVAVMPRCTARVDGTAHTDGLDRPATRWIRFRPLNATYVEGVRCSRTCRRATSAACQCDCGGSNHGREHGTPE